MIAKVCDICKKVENPERKDFYTFTYEYGFLRKEKGFHICTKCMMLIRELRAEQKEGEQNDR